MYIIKHFYYEYDGLDDSVLTESIIGITETETEAKEYCDRWENMHEYRQACTNLECGILEYSEIPLIKDLNKPPHEYNKSAAWAFDKNCENYPVVRQ